MPDDTHISVDLDFTDPTLPERLYDILGEMREKCPVAHVDRYGGFFALSRYQDVARAARDHEHFTTTQGIMIPPTGFSVRVLPVEADPPEHTAYRKLLLPYFTQRAMAEYEPAIREITVECIEQLAGLEGADLAEALAQPIPPIALALVLGLDRDDWPLMRTTITDVLRTRFEGGEKNKKAVAAFEEYLSDQIDRRRRQPCGDLLSTIVHGKIDGEPLAPDVVFGMIHLLIGAGHETTVHGIGNILYHLATIPGLREQLVQHPELIPDAVDESLRYDSPVLYLGRTVVRDTELGGVQLRPGDRTALLWGSANRDTDEFPDADRFVCPRDRNRHVAFGTGAHRCLGEPLARLEMAVVVEEVLQRLPAYRLADPAAVEWATSSNNRGVHTLPVVFDA